MAASPCLHELWGIKVQLPSLQAEFKGLMDHTAYLTRKTFGPCEDPCQTVQLSAVVLSSVPCINLQRRDRQTDKEESRCFWGFTVAMDTMSSLLNTCFCWHHGPGWSTQSRRSSSVPRMNPVTRADVCRLRRILISDNDDWEFQRQKKRRSSSLMWILWAARAPPQTRGVILVPCDAAC